MIRRPPRSTLSSSSAASDVYKRQLLHYLNMPVGYAYHTSEYSSCLQTKKARALIPEARYFITLEAIHLILNTYLIKSEAFGGGNFKDSGRKRRLIFSPFSFLAFV